MVQLSQTRTKKPWSPPAYLDDEPRLGPFPTRLEAALAAERAGWIKPESEEPK
jgi:hypothetical protein